MISAGTKKQELADPFKNNGREWEPGGEPVRDDTGEFPNVSWAERRPAASTTSP
ncbi:hypothetical protein [Streptomyces sp. NBC_00859]|uniref:hypothetical protein n=1 Tax=Streptomyces sp. NBC_00859 TaxID=2903682 RepID=UPI003864461F|nr:hypothetical protein OG584_32345 [Streptomyces sp. NBC_00859]